MKDLTGQKFGRLTVKSRAPNKIKSDGKSERMWWCECDCGNPELKMVSTYNLTHFKVQSCGCLHIESVSKENRMELDLFDEHGKYGIGFCNNTGNKFYFDMEDYEKIKNYCWWEHIDKKDGYRSLQAREKSTSKIIKMSTLLDCKNWDHQNHNPLNNRRYNLRPATSQENSRNRNIRKNNTSGIIGVSWDKKSQKWRAYIAVNQKHIYLGVFVNKYDAIVARLRAEKDIFKEFAPQQHLYEEYNI